MGRRLGESALTRPRDRPEWRPRTSRATGPTPARPARPRALLAGILTEIRATRAEGPARAPEKPEARTASPASRRPEDHARSRGLAPPATSWRPLPGAQIVAGA